MPPLANLTPPTPSAAESPTRYRAGDRLPAVLDLKDLSAILGLGASRIWELYEAGDFDFARLTPTIGNKPRFSGKQVQAWIDREPVETPRRFFQKGR
jgi:predicted DNA-binding transcriptional regulator AlpA